MKKPKLYLETSVWNFAFADDAPEKKRVTKQFFEEVRIGKYEIYISEIVTAEIAAAPEAKQKLLKGLVAEFDPVVLEDDEEIQRLAGIYVDFGVLSARHLNDLLHLAYASFNGMNALVSWNMAHLVKMKTHSLGNAANRAHGYHDIGIYTPQEVIDNDEN